MNNKTNNAAGSEIVEYAFISGSNKAVNAARVALGMKPEAKRKGRTSRLSIFKKDGITRDAWERAREISSNT